MYKSVPTPPPSPLFLNLAGEMVNWLPYGKSGALLPSVAWGLKLDGTVCVCVCVFGWGGEDLGSFTGSRPAGLISLICRQSGLWLRAQRLMGRRSRTAG